MMSTGLPPKGGTLNDSDEAFLSLLTRVAADIEALLDRLLAAGPLPGELSRPKRLLDAMRYASLNGGKRFRPFLVSASAGLFDVRSRAAEEIEVITDLRAGRVGGEWRKILRQRAQRSGAKARPLRSGDCVDFRVPSAARRAQMFPRRREMRLRGGKRAIVLQRPRH